MIHIKKFMILIINICFISFLLVGCGGGGDDDGDNTSNTPINVTNDEAQDSAVKAIYNGMSANMSNVNSVIFSTEGGGASAISSITSNEQFSSVIGADTANGLNEATNITDIISLATSDSEASESQFLDLIPEEDTTEEQYAAVVQQMMDTFLNEPVREGNTLTYTLNSDVICAEAGSANDATSCRLMLTSVVLIQNLTGENSGVLKFNLLGDTALELGYSETEVYVEGDLANIKTVLESFEPYLAEPNDPDPIQLPQTFTGKVRVSFAASSETDVSFSLSVPEAININGLMDGEMLDLQMAASTDLLTYSATESTGNLALNMGSFSTTVENNSSQTAPPFTQISMGGLTANISYDDNAEETVITNMGIIGELSVSAGTSADTLSEVINVTLDSFDATLSETDSSLIFDSAFNMDISITDSAGILSTGTNSMDMSNIGLSLSASQNTEITGDLMQASVMQVLNGSILLTGSGDLAGSVTASSGDCLGLSGVTEGMPIAVVDCSVMP